MSTKAATSVAKKIIKNIYLCIMSIDTNGNTIEEICYKQITFTPYRCFVLCSIM